MSTTKDKNQTPLEEKEVEMLRLADSNDWREVANHYYRLYKNTERKYKLTDTFLRSHKKTIDELYKRNNQLKKYERATRITIEDEPELKSYAEKFLGKWGIIVNDEALEGEWDTFDKAYYAYWELVYPDDSQELEELHSEGVVLYK